VSELSKPPLFGQLWFSGVTGATGNNFFANAGAVAAGAAIEVAQGFPAPGGARILRNLRVRCPVNDLVDPLAVTVQINGSNSTLTVTVTAGSTALFTDSTHDVAIAAGDRIDLKSVTVDGENVATLVASIEVL
jgi:hypothetical protein